MPQPKPVLAVRDRDGDTSGEPKRGPGRPPKYPWDHWLRPGSAWELHRDQDYDCKTSSIIASARREAVSRGIIEQFNYVYDGFLELTQSVTIWVEETDGGA